MEGDIKIIKGVETVFNNYINKYYPEDLKDKVNRCCNKREYDFLLKMGTFLKSLYPKTSPKDIYIALIYTYYSLTLGEQTDDLMYKDVYAKYADKPASVNKLFLKITTGDIMLNISEIIRRHMLGMEKKRPKSLSRSSIKSKSNSKTRKNRLS